jgi:hypothetical protein
MKRLSEDNSEKKEKCFNEETKSLDRNVCLLEETVDKECKYVNKKVETITN